MSVLVGTSGWSYDHWVDVLDPRKATGLERLDAYARGFRTVEVDNTFYNDGRRTKSSRPGASARPTASSPPSRRRGGSPSSASSTTRPPGSTGWWPAWRASPRSAGRSPSISLPTSRATSIGSTGSSARSPRDPARRSSSGTRRGTWRRRSPSSNATARRTASPAARTPLASSGRRPPSSTSASTARHGPDPHHLDAGSYSEDDLRGWADRIGERRAQGRDVYGHFNNDGQGHAVRDPLRLRELVAE